MTTLRPFCTLLLLVVGITCGACADEEDVSSTDAGTGVVVGVVRRLGEPAAAQVSLYRYLAIDPRDPFRPFRGMALERLRLRPAAASQPPLATAAVGEDGRFRFEGLEPGLYEVHALSPASAWAAATVVVPVAGAHVEATIHLPHRTATLTGRVVLADERAFEGVVEVQPGGWGGPYWRTARTRVVRPDASGRFHVEGLPHGPVVVAAFRAGAHRSIGEWRWLPHEGSVRVEVETEAAPVGGRVVDAETGLGLASVRVLAWGGASSWRRSAVREVVSGPDGRFVVTLPPGPRVAGATAPGGLSGACEVEAGLDEPFDLRLTRGATVRGRVVRDADGEPLPGVPVYAGIPGLAGTSHPPMPAYTLSGVDGRFTLSDLWLMELVVFAWGSGWTSPELCNGHAWTRVYDPHTVDLSAGSVTDVELRVVAAGRINGRVTSPDGEPVAGGTVRLIQAPLNSWRPMEVWLPGLGSVCTAVGEDGRYVLDSIGSEEPAYVRIDHASFARVDAQRPPLAAGEAQTFDVSLPKPRFHDVRVVAKDDGVTVADAHVWERRGRRSWRTNAEGWARVGPLGDEFDIQAAAPGLVTERGGWEGVTHRNVAELEEGAVATIELERGRDVVGRVVAPPGVPLALVDVTASWGEMMGGRGPWGTEWHTDGSFVIRDVPRVRVEVTARARWKGRGYGGSAVAALDGEPVVVRLEADEARSDPKVEVKVLRPDGTPASDGVVALHDLAREHPQHRHESLSGGSAALDAPTGCPSVWVEVYDLDDPRLGSTVAGPFDVTERPIVVRLPEGKSIVGVVRTPDGAPLQGSLVQAEPLHVGGHEFVASAHADARTDAQGAFRLDSLGPGRYRLVVGVPDRYLAAPDAIVEAGDKDVVVALRPAVKVVIRVEDSAGEPVEDARIDVRTEDAIGVDHEAWDRMRRRGRVGRAETDAEGVARLGGLDAEARFRLTVRPAGGSNLRGFQSAGWGPRDDTIRLERAYTLHGRVVDAEGKPLPMTEVLYRTAKGSPEPERTRVFDDGTFRIQGLPAGPVKLAARFRTSFPYRGASYADLWQVEVPAKVGEVTLTIADVGATLDVRIDGYVHPGAIVWADLEERGATSLFKARGCVEDGRVVFRGLDVEAKYSLWIHGESAGWYVLEHDLSPRDDALAVKAREGRAIRGTLHADRPMVFRGCHLWARERTQGLSANGTIEADGTFEVVGLPDGEWHLSGWVDGSLDFVLHDPTFPAGTEGLVLLLR